MSVSYGYGGFAPATTHQNVRKAWDTLLHEQVLNKSAWKGLTGADKSGEGDLDAEVVNKPIVLKTQLGKESGDQITMGLVASNVKQSWLSATNVNNFFNMGVSGNNQLVDNEGTLTLYNTKVKVAHQRFGIQIDGKMTLQRTPYDLLKVAKDRIAEQMAYFLDSDVFMTLIAGYGANVMRELGTASAATPTAHPNQIYGKGQSALTGVSAADVLDTNALEIVRVFLETANINPIMVDGEAHALLYVHPYNGKTLRADSAWVDANAFAMPRGGDNPVFQNMTGKWGGVVVKESNKIPSDFLVTDITKTTVSGIDYLTGSGGDGVAIAAATMGAGIAATDVYQCCLVGANAVARAFALESYMTRRKEDDYENIFGFGGGFIVGDRRADFQLSQDSGSDGATKNQSSAICHFYGPTVTVPTVWS